MAKCCSCLGQLVSDFMVAKQGPISDYVISDGICANWAKERKTGWGKGVILNCIEDSRVQYRTER